MKAANELHDRINRVINTRAFEAYLDQHGLDLIEFQCTWHKTSQGDFGKLPQIYQEAILAGEAELKGTGEVVLA
jgi:hypothetical protein